MKKLATLATLLVATLACGGGSADTPETPLEPGATVVIDWNERLLAVAEAEDGFLTLKGLRSAAMMHLAVHDALQAIDPRYRPFAWEGSSSAADPVAAAARAAYEVAADQYPDEAERFAAERDRWLATVDDAEARAEGERIGSEAAAAVLATRREDRWDGEAEYRWHPMAPGVYAEFAEHSGTPEGFVFGAGWAAAEPFVLPAASHFRAPPPPAIASAEYAGAFDEVRELGRTESDERTADQAHLAMWWKEFVEKSHNRKARELVVEEELGLWAAARLFAHLETAIYDAYVGVFDNKFHYNHWRPYTAIRWAAHDGNPETEPEPEWNNLHRHTYAFPSYPSAHGTACAAAMTVLADTFGDRRPFTMTIPEVDSAGPFSEKVAMDPPSRSFASFAEAAEECALSRLYLGIHFRYDSEAGNELGREVGSYVLDSSLRPVAG